MLSCVNDATPVESGWLAPDAISTVVGQTFRADAAEVSALAKDLFY